MADFKTLSLDEQKTIWMSVAQTVIEHWGLVVNDVSWLGYTNNAVFKVDAQQGSYVLRLHPPGRIDVPALTSELQWLRAIRHNTDLIAPFPYEIASDGMLFATGRSDDLPAPHTVLGTLFEHIDGQAKTADALTEDDMSRIGAYLAKLHTVGQFTPSTSFVRPTLDWEGLFGEASLYNPRENAHVITDGQLAVFDAVAKRVQDVMQSLGQSQDAFGLVHADLLAKNILFHEGDVRALDFEYAGWGYFLYDLTPILWQLKSDRAEDYVHLEDAMWAGYTRVKPQTDNHRDMLDVFIAGRQLASCRWLAVNLGHPAVRDVAPQLLAQRTDELQQFLKTGKLNRKSKSVTL